MLIPMGQFREPPAPPHIPPPQDPCRPAGELPDPLKDCPRYFQAWLYFSENPEGLPPQEAERNATRALQFMRQMGCVPRCEPIVLPPPCPPQVECQPQEECPPCPTPPKKISLWWILAVAGGTWYLASDPRKNKRK